MSKTLRSVPWLGTCEAATANSSQVGVEAVGGSPKTKLWHWVLASHCCWQSAAVEAVGEEIGCTLLLAALLLLLPVVLPVLDAVGVWLHIWARARMGLAAAAEKKAVRATMAVKVFILNGGLS